MNRAILTAWYDKHIAARWWASSAMWVGIAAGAVEYLPDWLQMGLDQLDLLGGVFAWDESTKRVIQSFMLFVILPIAKAWRQKSMQAAALKQAAKTGAISSPSSSQALLIDVPGLPPSVVIPDDTVAQRSGV